jgi:tetratricopeptide (TPR) repeat protein
MRQRQFPLSKNGNLDSIQQIADSDKKWAILVHSIDQCLEAKNYTQAEPLALFALELMEEHEETDARLIKTLRSLSRIYYATERYSLGAPILKRLVKIYMRLLGPEHEDTATIMQNAALLYHYWGKQEEAERYYLRALDVKKKLLGENDPQVLKLMSHYISFLEQCGRSDEAKRLSSEVQKVSQEKMTRTGQWEAISSSEPGNQLTR